MTTLSEQLNHANYDFFFLVVDKFLDIKAPQIKNFYSIYDPDLAVKNSGYLLAHPNTQSYIHRIASSSGHKVAIVPFKPSAKIDNICKKNNWLLVANPSPLNRLLEDKIKFYEFCQKYSIPLIPSTIEKFSIQNYTLAQKTYGEHLVVQTHFGWAGNCSFLSTNFSDISNKISPGTVVKYSRYLDGYSLINNCCLIDNKVVQSPPGLQYTGIPSLTTNPLATVGRQWPCLAPQHILEQVKKITLQFSEILIDLNYSGFFGLDFLVSDERVFLIECNPRLTASFAFYTDIELKNNIDPLFYYHLASFLHIHPNIVDRFNLPFVGSEITKKDASGTTIAKFNDYRAFSKTNKPIAIDPVILDKNI